MLTFQNVTKVLNGREVLKDITFRIVPGEFVCLAGPCEAGKTLLLHLLLGAVHPTSGIVAVDGVDLASLSPTLLRLYRRSVGIAFGAQLLLSDRNVAQNVALPLDALGVSTADAATRVGTILERVNLLPRSSSLPGDLTDGERQRIVVARSLVTNPKLLLVDNISPDLEDEDREEFLNLLVEANTEGMTVVLATRDREPWAHFCTRLIALENGCIDGDEHLRERTATPSQHPRQQRGVHIVPTPVA